VCRRPAANLGIDVAQRDLQPAAKPSRRCRWDPERREPSSATCCPALICPLKPCSSMQFPTTADWFASEVLNTSDLRQEIRGVCEGTEPSITPPIVFEPKDKGRHIVEHQVSELSGGMPPDRRHQMRHTSSIDRLAGSPSGISVPDQSFLNHRAMRADGAPPNTTSVDAFSRQFPASPRRAARALKQAIEQIGAKGRKADGAPSCNFEV